MTQCPWAFSQRTVCAVHRSTYTRVHCFLHLNGKPLKRLPGRSWLKKPGHILGTMQTPENNGERCEHGRGAVHQNLGEKASEQNGIRGAQWLRERAALAED